MSTFNERMAREFMAQGHEVVIWSFTLQYPGFLFPGKTQLSDDPRPTDLDIRVRVNSVNPFNWLKVGSEVRKAKPDLVVFRFWLPFMGPCFGTIARQIRKNKHTRIVTVVDNAIPHEKRPGDRAFTKYFFAKVDAFIAMSREVLHDLDVFDTQKPRKFIPHPLYDNYGQPKSRAEALTNLGLDPETRYLLFFGFVREYKGLDLLLTAMSDERIRKMNLKLIIAGEFYQNEDTYDAQIAELGIADQLVRRHEFIPNEAVGDYFCAADMVVQPYKTATNSGVTQIAYHYAIPMMVTNVGGLPENVPDGKVGYVVERDPAEIAEAIVKFYTEDKFEEFSRNTVAERSKYSWEVFINAIQELAGQVK
ncbi:MAG: glycosyltransferase [Bacteroidia bacterium]|nr:glycosyltransferase [Bacteroidia bacterium]